MSQPTDMALQTRTRPRIRAIGMDRPWAWLARGLDDMRAARGVSLAWALGFTLAGAGMIAALASVGAYDAILPLAAGFPLVAPILVVGLYEISRKIERGEPVTLLTPLAALRRNAGQLGLLGFALGFAFLAWMRIALLLFALFFGTTPVSGTDFVSQIVFTGANFAFLAVGTAIGAMLAAVVFAVSVVSVPLLLDRDESVFGAVATSWAAVRANPKPMLLWAVLVALLVGAGLLLALVGLVVTLPLIAHATWHAYRDVVATD
jgi:uncharacterized membrane protein